MGDVIEPCRQFSRAKNSLAIVAYSSDPQKVRDHVVREGWFESGEVEIVR
jgi:DNA helicase II / ATP-dependent DNA helicase PcrA